MSDYVTDEMVDAAAHASFRDGFMRHAPEHETRELSDYDDGIRESWRVVARAALEAVAPLIAAAALRDAADREMTAWEPVLMSPDWVEAIESVCETLRARADRIEREGL